MAALGAAAAGLTFVMVAPASAATGTTHILQTHDDIGFKPGGHLSLDYKFCWDPTAPTSCDQVGTVRTGDKVKFEVRDNDEEAHTWTIVDKADLPQTFDQAN